MRTKLVIVAIVILLLVVVLLGGRSMYDTPPPTSNVMSSSNVMSDGNTTMTAPPGDVSPPGGDSMMAKSSMGSSGDDSMEKHDMGPPGDINNHDMDSMGIPGPKPSTPGLKEAITGYIPGLKAAPLEKMSLDTIWSKAKSGDHQAQCDFGKMLSNTTVNESDY
jgi:hypothetical protein